MSKKPRTKVMGTDKSTADQRRLTFAGIGVASLGWSPRQVMVEILTLFTVKTLGVVVTHAVPMNL